MTYIVEVEQKEEKNRVIKNYGANYPI